MARNVIKQWQNQPSMAAGEIAPELYGRVDQELYYIGLRTCKNFVIRQYGGAANRPGTYFVAEVKDHSKEVCLIPFQFNEEQTYVIEAGDQYFRFISAGAEIVETAKNITAITKANPGVVTIAGHGYSNGDDVYLKDIGGMVELNARTVRLKNIAANTFELTDFFGNNIDTTNYSTYTSGGTAARVYGVSSPYLEADLFELNYSQSNDVLTVVHNDYYPRDITRTANTAWTVTQFANEEGPFKTANSTATTMTVNAETGSVTVTASTGVFDSSWVGELLYLEQKPSDTTKRWEPGKSISSGDVRLAGAHYYKASNTATSGTYRPDHTEGTSTDGDNGVTWEYLHSGFGVVELTAYSTTTTMTGTVKKRVPANIVSTPTDNWARSAWSATEGYPAAVAYHKQRLVFGGTKKQPNGLQFSGVGARKYFGKENPILDDDAITLLLDSTQQANALRHLIPLKQMIALTSGAEHLINGPNNLILATDPPFADVQGYTGSSVVRPIIIGNTGLFVQEKGTVIRSLQYALQDDAFTGVNLTARSPHLFQGKQVVQWAFQREPLSVVWCVMNDGTLNGFTYMAEQEVFAWHWHETDGYFESVCSVSEGEEDAVYFVVRREINGQTKRYVEKLASRYFNTVKDAHFVDCGLVYDGRNYTEDDKGVRTAKTAVTMTISGGTTWDKPETLTVTASSAQFKAADVGDQVVFPYVDASGNYIDLRLNITAYTSGAVVSAIPTKQVPTALRSTATKIWSLARDVFMPLHHLDGEAVAVLADGNVVEEITVSGGKVTIPDPASVVHVGLPYKSQLETLDIARPQGELKGKTVTVPRVFLTVQESRAVFVGTDGFTGELIEYKQRDPSIGYDAPIPAETDVFEVQTTSTWSNKGRVCIEQPYPLPVTINCITPEVILGSN